MSFISVKKGDGGASVKHTGTDEKTWTTMRDAEKGKCSFIGSGPAVLVLQGPTSSVRSEPVPLCCKVVFAKSAETS